MRIVSASASRVALAVLFALCAPSRLPAQEVPPNARAASDGKGWVCNQGYVERGNECVVLGAATDEELRRYLIRESIAAYSGSCPCPYNYDRAGRRCGGRSAYSRPGGRSPLCFPDDVSDEQIRSTRERYPGPQKPTPEER